MRKLTLFLLTLVVSLSGCKAEANKAETNSEPFAIEGATITPALLNNAKVVNLMNLAYFNGADNEVLLLYPNTGVMLSYKPDVLKTMFPDVKTYVVDGKKVSEKDFYGEAAKKLFAVKYADGTLNATTRTDANDDPLPTEGMSDAGRLWLIEGVANGVTIPESIVVNDPLTMPEGSMINGIDYLMVSPEKAADEAKWPGMGFTLQMVGTIPELTLTDNAARQEETNVPCDGKVTVPVKDLKSLSVKDIVEAIPNSIEEVTAINYVKDTVTVFLLSPEARAQVAQMLKQMQD